MAALEFDLTDNPHNDDQLVIRLTRIVESQDPVLRRLLTLADEFTGLGRMRITIVDSETIRAMAEVCGVEVLELIDLLRAAEAIVEHRSAAEGRG